MEALQMLKYSTKKRRDVLNFTSGLRKETELEQMENEQQSQIVEDLPSFSKTLTNADVSV